jgi:hypothetical protein
VAIGLMVYLYEDTMTYIALYMVLALPVLSYLLTALTRRRFIVTEQLEPNVIAKGEAAQLVIIVTNLSFMPAASVRVRFKANSAAVVTDIADQYLTVWPFKSVETIFNVSAKYRGHYEIGISSITLYDFLGIFRFQQAHDQSLELTVTPRVIDVDPLPLSVAQSGIEDAKNFTFEEDYAVISDLRKYQPTDGYKKIHWKISAKKNELISKNYQNTKRQTAAFIIDNSKIFGTSFFNPEEEVAAMEDAIMEACVSSLAYCVSKRHNCSLHYAGSEASGRELRDYSGDFDYLYLQACDIKFSKQGNNDFNLFLSNYSKTQTDADNIIILTKELTDTIYAAVQNLFAFGNNIIIIYFKEATKQQAQRINFLRDLGIYCRRGVTYDRADET